MSISLEVYNSKLKEATLVALLVNTLLGFFKILVGILISSIALIADGFDSVMDLLMGGFAYIGALIAKRPADEHHLYGHAKMEIFFLLLIIGVIFTTGVGIFWQAIDRLINNIQLEFSVLGLIITILSILGKIFISFYVHKTAIFIGSATLRATAFNYLTDVFSSGLVALAIVASLFNVGLVDSIAAIIICFLIIYGAFKMLLEAFNILLDRAPPEIEINRIIKIANSIEGVKEVHRLRARIIGGKIVGDLHVLVDPDISVVQGHIISDRVMEALKMADIDIIVHIEPFDSIHSHTDSNP